MQKTLTPQHPLEDDLFHLRFTDDIDMLGYSEEELQQLNERLEKTAAGYGIGISCDKTKFLVSSIKPRSSTNIWKNGKTLEDVVQFKYLGCTQAKDGTSIKDPTGASTLSHDDTIEKHGRQFLGETRLRFALLG